MISGARLSSHLNGNAAGSMAVVTGEMAEADVRLPAVATHEFYQPRPSQTSAPHIRARERIRSARWERQITIAPEKYEPVSHAILTTLGATRCGGQISRSEYAPSCRISKGRSEWYTIACLREFETQRKIQRDPGFPNESAPVAGGTRKTVGLLRRPSE